MSVRLLWLGAGIREREKNQSIEVSVMGDCDLLRVTVIRQFEGRFKNPSLGKEEKKETMQGKDLQVVQSEML